MIDKSEIHLSSLFSVFLSLLPSSSPSLFPFILASPSPLSPLKETFPLPSFPQGQHPKPPSSLFIDTYSLQLPCWDFQFLGDLTASNINTSSFPRYLLSPLMWAHNPHFIYRLNCVQSQNSKVNNPPGLCIPFFVTWASLLAQLGKNPPAMREAWDRSLGWGIPWRRERLPTLVFWPGEFHGLYSPWGWKSQTQLSDFHFLVTEPLSSLALKLLENRFFPTSSPTLLVPCSGSARCHWPLLPHRTLSLGVTYDPSLLHSWKS